MLYECFYLKVLVDFSTTKSNDFETKTVVLMNDLSDDNCPDDCDNDRDNDWFSIPLEILFKWNEMGFSFVVLFTAI